MNDNNKDIEDKETSDDALEGGEWLENHAEKNDEVTDADDVDDEGTDTMNDEEPSLHSLNFEPSESRTTNIPPRLPVGFSYASASLPTNAENKGKKKKKAAKHPDLPTASTISQEEMDMRIHNKRHQLQHRNRAWTATMRWAKRYGIGIFFALIVIAGATTYQLWMPIVNNWHFNDDKELPVVAADTLPLPVKTKVDTATTPKLTVEDSLRIQDSIRHVRWLYSRRYKQAKEAKLKDELNAKDAANSNAATTSANSEPHTQIHANDSTQH